MACRFGNEAARGRGIVVATVAGTMTPEAFRDALVRSGITSEKPLYPVLLTVWEAAETAHMAATDGARGLTAEGERALIDKVGSEVAVVAEREVERLIGRFDRRRALQSAALGLVLLGVGYGVGRWDGGRQGAAAIEGASFVAQILSLNDPRLLAQRCRETQRTTQGGMACELPSVWVKR